MKIKILFVFILSFLCIGSIKAQNIGNEWINYNQSYYKFQIVHDGVYRITYNDLIAAGVPIIPVNPQNIQIWGRGQQVPIYINNESGGVFTNSTFIEFYAQKNDGWLDSNLYEDPSHQLHLERSLYTDTAVYFLTWTNTLPNPSTHLRLETVSANNYSSYTAEPYFWYVSGKYYSASYYHGVTNVNGYDGGTNPKYLDGELFCDWPHIQLGNAAINRPVPTSNMYANGPQAQISIDVIGGSDAQSINIDHHLRISFENEVHDELYSGKEVKNFVYNVNVSDLNSSSTTFSFESINDLSGVTADRTVLSNIEIRYPHTNDLNNQTEFVLSVPDGSNGYAYYNFTNFNTGSSPVLYDVDNNKRIIPTISGSNLQVLVPNSGGEKECYLAGNGKIRSVINLGSIGNNAKFVDYLSLYSSADYFIITHPKLMSSPNYQGALDYAAYRAGQGYNVMVVNILDLYPQYAYGVMQHPLSIKNFMRDVHQSFNHELKALLLIGKGVKFSKARAANVLYKQNLVPTMGTPGSDILLTSGIKDASWQPLLPTGRISAKNIAEVDIYLDKLKDYEAVTDAEAWQKEVLHFKGGFPQEQNTFTNYLNGYTNTIEDTLFGGHVETISKTTTDPLQFNLTQDIINRIDDGIGMITYIGHAANIGFDISLGDPQDYKWKSINE